MAALWMAWRSYWVIPSWNSAKVVRRAAIVMSLARCISAISAADLIIRHPAVTGSALTSDSAGATWRNAIHDEKPAALFDTDLSGADPAILEYAGDDLVGTLVLLPDPHIGADAESLAGPGFLEPGADEGQFARRRHHRHEGPFRESPSPCP